MTDDKCWCGSPVTIHAAAPICTGSIYHDPFKTGPMSARLCKIIYIAGPMSNIPDNNRPMFNTFAETLRAAGFTVVNPAEYGAPSADGKAGYLDLLREDIRQMLTCDGVCIMPDWWASNGARKEVDLAGHLGMPVLGIDGWLEA